MRRADGHTLTVGETKTSGFGNREQKVRQYSMTIMNGNGVVRQDYLEAINFVDFAGNIDREQLAPDDVILSVTMMNDGTRSQTAQ